MATHGRKGRYRRLWGPAEHHGPSPRGLLLDLGTHRCPVDDSLEYQVLVFYQHLVGREQDTFTHWVVSKLIREALKQVHRLPPADRALAEAWLREADAITKKRNDYVHNMWPAQGDGHLFGWRMANRPNAQASIMSHGTMEEMQGDLDRLIALLRVNRLHRVQGLVSGGQHLNN